MKRKFLTLVPITFLLCSCKFKIKWPWSKETKPDPVHQQQVVDTIDDVDTVDDTIHATSVSAEPNASFYLKVGETRDLKMTLSPSPTLTSEKTFTWTCADACVKVEVDSTNSAKAKVTGLKAGDATITATNDFSNILTKDFKVKVIDFNVDNNYLWQYSSTDRAQFGYDYGTAKAGTPSGTAVLAGKEWSYTRSKASSLQTSNGALGFGKNGEPETSVHLETESNRIVEKIVIQAASAHSLGKMTVKVGDTVLINNETLSAISYDEVPTIESDLSSASGNISIDFVTPEYDPSQVDNPDYVAPGAVYLKSILIYYANEDIDHLEIGAHSRHQIDWTEGDVFSTVGLAIDKVTVRGTHLPINCEEEFKTGKLVCIEPNMSEASHELQKVYLKYTIEGYHDSFELSYDIHVRGNDWIPEKIEISGVVIEQHLIAGDDVSYDQLSIKVIYDTETSDYSVYPFEDNGIFTFTYGSGDADPFVAEAVMSNGFNMYVSGTFGKTSPTVISGSYKVNPGILFVQDAVYDKIDFRKAALVDELGLNSSYKEVTYKTSNERLTLHFDSVKKDGRYDNKNIKLPATNKNFQLVVNDKNRCIDNVNIQFADTSSKSNAYRLCESVFGGTIYGEPVVQAEYNKIVARNLTSVTNAVELIPGLASNESSLSTTCTGIVSILVRYNDNAHVDYEISAGETKPLKTAYNEGEVFDPNGLTITLSSEYEETSLDITEYIKWYDGSTYATAKQETLLPTSKSVVGEFNNKTIEIAIDSVTERQLSLTKVKNASEITAEGKYYITCPSNHLVLKASTKNGDLLSGKGCSQEETAFGETLDLNILFEDDYFTFTPLENGKFTIRNHLNADPTKCGYIGLTKGGSGTCSASCPNKEFSIEIDENGIATMMISAEAFDTNDVSKGIVTMYLGGGKEVINLYKDNKLNLAIYKLN